MVLTCAPPAPAADPTECKLTGLPGNLFRAALDPAGDTLASLSAPAPEHQYLTLWDLKAGTGRVLAEYKDRLWALDDWQTRLASTDAGRTLLVDRDGFVEIWDVAGARSSTGSTAATP